MPAVSLTFSSEDLQSTMYLIGQEVRDQADYALPFLVNQEETWGKGKPEDEGGLFFIEPMEFDEHSQTTQLTTGYELVDMTVRSLGVPARDDWMHCVRPIVISEIEKRKNRGSARIVDIAKQRAENVMRGFKRELHRRIWGVGTTRMTDLNTANGLDFADGFFENAAVASQSNTWHNVSRATYATSIGWQHQYYDVANSASANLATAMDDIGARLLSIRGSKDKGQKRKPVYYCSIAAFKNLRRLNRSREMLASKDQLDLGRLVMQWDGVPVEVNHDMPTSGSTTTTYPLSIARIDHGSMKLRFQKDYYFSQSARPSPTDQLVDVQLVQLSGQLECMNHADQALIVRAETW